MAVAKAGMGPNGVKYAKYVDKGADLAATQITKRQLREPKVQPQQPGKSSRFAPLDVWVVDDGRADWVIEMQAEQY